MANLQCNNFFVKISYLWVYFMLSKGVKDSVSSVTQSCLTFCHPMDCRTPYFPVLYQLSIKD